MKKFFIVPVAFLFLLGCSGSNRLTPIPSTLAYDCGKVADEVNMIKTTVDSTSIVGKGYCEIAAIYGPLKTQLDGIAGSCPDVNSSMVASINSTMYKNLAKLMYGVLNGYHNQLCPPNPSIAMNELNYIDRVGRLLIPAAEAWSTGTMTINTSIPQYSSTTVTTSNSNLNTDPCIGLAVPLAPLKAGSLSFIYGLFKCSLDDAQAKPLFAGAFTVYLKAVDSNSAATADKVIDGLDDNSIVGDIF